MKFQSSLLFALASILQSAQCSDINDSDWQWSWEWGFAPDCARSCLSSAFPTTASASWASPCASPTGLSSCVNSACSVTETDSAKHSSAVSVFSVVTASICSVYSSCSSSPSACVWPYWGGPSGWGNSGSNGYYTYSCTDGRSTGWTTTTTTVTSTSTGTAGTSVFTTAITETATLVAAGVAGSGTSTGAKPTSTGNSAGQQSVHVWAVGAAMAVGVGALAML